MLCYYSHFKDEESGAEKGTNFLGKLMHLFIPLLSTYLFNFSFVPSTGNVSMTETDEVLGELMFY